MVSPTTWIEIDGAAFCHNYLSLKELVAPTQIVVVMKSDAYGLGLAMMVPVLKQARISWIALNDVQEALDARQYGYNYRIIVLGPVLAEHLAMIRDGDIQVAVSNQAVLSAWLALDESVAPDIHLKVDTGMGRQGFYPAEVENIMATLQACGRCHKVVGVMSHTSNAVVAGCPYQSLRQQRQRFIELKTKLQRFPLEPIYHMSASHGALVDVTTHFDAVRLGLSLFGGLPYPWTFEAMSAPYKVVVRQLKGVLRWFARVVQTKVLQPGARVGYEGTYTSVEDETMALVGVGYFHGYHLPAQASGYMMAHGFAYPVIGKVSMSITALKVPQGAPVLREGDCVTLVGADLDHPMKTLTLNEFSQAAGRNPNEVLTSLHPSIPRRVV